MSVLVVVFKVLRYLVILIALVVIGVGIGAWVTVSKGLPDTSHLSEYHPQQTTKLYSREGKLLGELHVQNREIIPLSRIPRCMQNATIAIEDERFFKHMGADPRGLLRAAYHDYKTHDYSQGGSTITEQLAKNIYLSREKTLYRRLRQMLLAMQIERQYSKEEILQFYLNEVCYGHNCFGVQAASHYYFGKDASELTVSEAALLAGIPRAPSRYSPYDHPEAALARRNLVLRKMVELGFLTWDEGERAKAEKPNLVDPKKHHTGTPFKAPYFTTVAVKELVDRYGVDMVYKSGLRVTTTLSLPLEQHADLIIRKALKRYKRMHVGQCALVCLDPYTGEILALVGGRNWNDKKGGQYNRATQARRQPGSSFKPYVYATALDAGYRPNSKVIDEPVSYPDGGKLWKPRNYDGKYRGVITLETALAYSVNIPAIKLNVKLGPAKVAMLAHRLGIRSRLDPVKSLALGTSGVTLLEHCLAYGVFATGGIRVEPTTILRVCDAQGGSIDRHVPQRKWVLNRNTAAMVTQMLITAVERGTGRRARMKGVQVAGKTGTSQDKKDVWFMGYTPDLVTGVWCGNDDNSPMRGRGVAGGLLCAPIWKQFMTVAVKKFGGRHKFVEVKIDPLKAPPVDDLTQIEASTEGIWVNICTETGRRATPYCPSVQRKRFPPDAELPPLCDVHGRVFMNAPPSPSTAASTGTPFSSATSSPHTVTVTVCTESGRLATPYCPSTKVETFPAGAAPTTRCNLHSASAPADSRPPAIAPTVDEHRSTSPPAAVAPGTTPYPPTRPPAPTSPTGPVIRDEPPPD